MNVIDIEGLKTEIERVDDIPLIYGMLKQMGIQAIVDEVIEPHGNWQGLNPGWVIMLWLVHILSEQSHLMEPVQEWTRNHLTTLRRLTGQEVTELDMTDDHLALCLSYLSKGSTWKALEERLGQRTLRIYGLEAKRLRLDATVGKVGHAPEKHTLFKVGKAKKGGYEVQFKLSLASIDPLGLPIVCDVAPGNRADDPLYVPSYQRAKKVLDNRGLLVVGDSKMNGQRTLATIVLGGDYYLTPLSPTKDEPGLVDELIGPWRDREQEAMRIFPLGDIAPDGEGPDPESAIAHGFESQRERTVLMDGKLVGWTERLLVVRSYSYQKTEQAALQERLDKAEKALKALTPPRGRGQKQIEKEAALLKAIRQIEKQYRVQGLFDLSYVREMEERHVRGYRGQPARIERKVRYQLSVARNEEAIAAAEFRAGWRGSVKYRV